MDAIDETPAVSEIGWDYSVSVEGIVGCIFPKFIAFSIEKASKFSSRSSRCGIEKKERRAVRLHGYSTSDLFIFRVTRFIEFPDIILVRM